MTDMDRNLAALIKTLHESGFMDMVVDEKVFFEELTKNLKEYFPDLYDKGSVIHE